MRSHINTNIILLCTSLLVALLGAEIILRTIYDAPPGTSYGNHQLFGQYDPVLGWKKRPLADGMYVTSEYEIRETMNSKGIRGPEYTYAKQKNEYRTLILGDSFSEGYTVNFNEIFSEIMKSRLNKNNGGRHQVINSGTGGYSTDQELLDFMHEGKKYKPDLTVLMFYDNDVWYNNQPKYWRGYKPQFQIVDGALTLTNVPVPMPDNKTVAANNKEQGMILPYLGELAEKNLYLYAFISNKSIYQAVLRKMAMGMISTANAKSDHVPGVYRVYDSNPGEEINEAWDITERLIEELKKETAAIGSDLVIFYVPKREGVYNEKWERMKRVYGMSGTKWDVTLVRDRIKDICNRKQVKFIDPLNAFRDEANDLQRYSKRLYFQKDGHWTAEGHAFAGNILAEYVEDTHMKKEWTQDVLLASN